MDEDTRKRFEALEVRAREALSRMTALIGRFDEDGFNMFMRANEAVSECIKERTAILMAEM